MAGRPAPSRGGGASGLLYGMIVLAVVSVLSLVLFVLMFTRVKAAEDAAARAAAQQRQWGSPPAYYANEAGNRRGTVFGVMSDELGELGALVSGQKEANSLAVREFATKSISDAAAKHSDVVRAGDSLVAAVTELSSALEVERSAKLALNEKLEAAQAQIADLAGQQKTIREEFEGQVRSFGERISQLEGSRDETIGQKDRQVDDLTSQLEGRTQEVSDLRRDFDGYRRDMEFEQSRAEKRVSDLQTEVRALRPNQFKRDAILKKADGKILRAVPGSEVVYINLGEKDGAKVGLGLEVYSRSGEQRDSVRGKGSIEIVTVSDTVSECRVTRRTPGSPLLEGDVVLNIAFERNRKPRFVVRGDFDLNYDNVIDPQGRETVEGLVRKWGGQTVDKLDESIDYVVVGLAPNIPVAPSGQLTDVVRDQQFQRELQASRFAELIAAANRLALPVITQNQFLFLTGYSGDAPIQVRP